MSKWPNDNVRDPERSGALLICYLAISAYAFCFFPRPDKMLSVSTMTAKTIAK